MSLNVVDLHFLSLTFASWESKKSHICTWEFFPRKRGRGPKIFHRPHKKAKVRPLKLIFHTFFFYLYRLGEGEGSMPVSWTTLNPEQLVQQMKSFNFELDAFEDFMKTVCFIQN